MMDLLEAFLQMVLSMTQEIHWGKVETWIQSCGKPN